MPEKKYELEQGGEKRLSVAWKGAFKDVNVVLDGQSIGQIPDQKALLEGQDFMLDDGSTLRLQLKRSLMSTELHVTRDGEPLPGSASDPVSRFKNAYLMVYLIAGFNLLLGLLAVVFNIALLQDLGLGFTTIILGLIYLVLAFFVQRKSLVALILAIVLFTADSLLGLVLSVLQGASPGIAGLLVRVFVIILMVQGVPAIKALRSKMA